MLRRRPPGLPLSRPPEAAPRPRPHGWPSALALAALAAVLHAPDQLGGLVHLPEDVAWARLTGKVLPRAVLLLATLLVVTVVIREVARRFGGRATRAETFAALAWGGLPWVLGAAAFCLATIVFGEGDLPLRSMGARFVRGAALPEWRFHPTVPFEVLTMLTIPWSLVAAVRRLAEVNAFATRRRLAAAIAATIAVLAAVALLVHAAVRTVG